MIARLAAGQHGVVSAAQLRAMGLDKAAIQPRRRAGRLHRLHRGVYLVGHAVPPLLAPEMAALLACGSSSVISHRSAAHLWGLAAPRQAGALVEVTVHARNLAAVLPIDELEVAMLDARARRLVHDRDLRRVLERTSGQRGRGTLRRLLELERREALAARLAAALCIRS